MMVHCKRMEKVVLKMYQRKQAYGTSVMDLVCQLRILIAMAGWMFMLQMILFNRIYCISIIAMEHLLIASMNISSILHSIPWALIFPILIMTDCLMFLQ